MLPQTHKHHRGMASAGSDASPRDCEGWCLPIPLDILAPVYDWFTEGFDTADLKDAKALLDEL